MLHTEDTVFSRTVQPRERGRAGGRVRARAFVRIKHAPENNRYFSYTTFLLVQNGKKCKVAPTHAIHVEWGSGDIPPPTIHLGARKR